MGTFRSRQGGWVGLIAMLLALAIVAYLSRDALRKYGLMPSTGETSVVRGGASGERGGTPGERARAPAAVDASGTTVESAATVPNNAIDRARGLESTIHQQAGQRSGGN